MREFASPVSFRLHHLPRSERKVKEPRPTLRLIDIGYLVDTKIAFKRTISKPAKCVLEEDIFVGIELHPNRLHSPETRRAIAVGASNG
jgi:hypothetical protein